MSLTESSSCAGCSPKAEACILGQLCSPVATLYSGTDCTSISIDGPLVLHSTICTRWLSMILASSLYNRRVAATWQMKRGHFVVAGDAVWYAIKLASSWNQVSRPSHPQVDRLQSFLCLQPEFQLASRLELKTTSTQNGRRIRSAATYATECARSEELEVDLLR
jgi:hypothetical protein